MNKPNNTVATALAALSSRMPPHNIEAEQSILSAVLVDPEAILKVTDKLVPHDFYREDHAIIFEYMVKLFEKRKPIDILTLTDLLESAKKLSFVGGAGYIATLTGYVNSSVHISHHADIVRNKAMLRKLITAGSKIAELGYKEDGESDIVLDEAEATLFGVSQTYLSNNFVPIGEILSDSFDRIDELHKNKGAMRGIPTGFKDLDTLLGGLQRSDLVILAARPSMGKTALCLNIAEFAAIKGKAKVAIFSLEQSKDQLVDRILCSQAGVDSWKLRSGNLSDDDFPRIGQAMGILSEASIFIDDTPGQTVLEVRTKARRLQMEHGLDLIIIDYLQLMQGRGQENRVQEVSEISRSLKGVARELNAPVVALSQLSRAVEARPDKRPMLSDLRESGCLSGEARIVRADTGEQVKIKDLVGQTNIPVWSLNNEFKIVQKTISKVFSSGYKQVFELRFRSGRALKASANHKFKTYTDWVRLDELAVGQRLALPRNYAPKTTDNPDYSNDLLIFLAHMIGDGCYVSRQPLHYTSNDPQNIAVVARAAKQLYGIDVRIVPQETWFHVYVPSPYPTARGKRHPFYHWLISQGLTLARSYEKKLPESLFRCSSVQLRLFLHHLWATDGCITYHKDKGTIYYASTSSVLAEQIQHLLLRLGIQSRIACVKQVKKGKSFRSAYHVTIQGKTNQELFLKLVGCYGERGKKVDEYLARLLPLTANPNTDTVDLSVWQELITPAKEQSGLSWRQFQTALGNAYSGASLFKRGLSRERLARVAHIVPSPTLSRLAASDIYWDEIVSITPLLVEEVFDATVPGTHNFIANDIVVHNSIEQDADVVMFIYRDEYYEKDTEKKNLAEILVRKHRNGPVGEITLYFQAEQTKFRNLDKRAQH